MAKATAKVARDDDIEAETGAAGEPELQPGRRLPGKKIVLFIVAPVLALLIIAAASAYYFGVFRSEETLQAGEEGHDQAEPEHKAAFFDLPEILVNLNTSGKKEAYLKVRISLELENSETAAALEPLMPRVIDNFQVFLREMRPEDISGSAGMIRLKEELMRRINLSVQPVTVRDVLFKEILVQ